MNNIFTIIQGADLPRLTLQCLRKPGDGQDKLKNLLEDVEVSFSLADVKSGEYLILQAPAMLNKKLRLIESMETEDYFLQYRFSKKETRHVGRYRAEFLLKIYKQVQTGTDELGNPVYTRTLDGEMKLPEKHPLYVEIKDSIL